MDSLDAVGFGAASHRVCRSWGHVVSCRYRRPSRGSRSRLGGPRQRPLSALCRPCHSMHVHCAVEFCIDCDEVPWRGTRPGLGHGTGDMGHSRADVWESTNRGPSHATRNAMGGTDFSPKSPHISSPKGWHAIETQCNGNCIEMTRGFPDAVEHGPVSGVRLGEPTPMGTGTRLPTGLTRTLISQTRATRALQHVTLRMMALTRHGFYHRGGACHGNGPFGRGPTPAAGRHDALGVCRALINDAIWLDDTSAVDPSAIRSTVVRPCRVWKPSSEPFPQAPESWLRGCEAAALPGRGT